MQIRTTPFSVPPSLLSHTGLPASVRVVRNVRDRGTFITGAQHISPGSTAKFNFDGRDFTADHIRDYDRYRSFIWNCLEDLSVGSYFELRGRHQHSNKYYDKKNNEVIKTIYRK